MQRVGAGAKGELEKMREHAVVGKRIAGIDGTAKVTGDADFTEDIVLARMLHGKILRSPHPHARILSIDTGRATRLPGVRAIITGGDTYGLKYGLYPEARDECPLAMDKVRYVGDEVAAVAAVDEDTAEEAMSLIQVEYDVLPAVFDPEEAVKEGAPRIHDHVERNITVCFEVRIGDVEAGFAGSDYVREDRFETEAIGHCMLEPYVALASYDSSGKLDIWTPNQSPFTKRRALSNLLKLPLNNVRVLSSYIGGAFGGRSEMLSLDFCAGLLSMKAGRPVRIVYTREETFDCTRQKHPWIITLKTGVKRDGTLLAKHFRIMADGGAYASTAGIAVGNPLPEFLGLFRLPNIRYEAVRVYTNKPVRGAMRGHGNQQLRFADGSQLDIIAQQLNLDPIEIRRKNVVRTGDVTLNECKVFSCGLDEAMSKVAEASRWKAKRGTPEPYRGIGIGISSMICGFSLGVRTASTAFLKFNEDGGATVITGAQDNGQGNWSMMAQVAAEELGLRVEDIKIVAADTEITPQDPGTYTMSATFVSANAVKAAADDARRQLLEAAAESLEANVADLVARDRRIYVQGSPERSISVAQATWSSLSKGRPILGRGFWQPQVDDVDWVKGKIMGQTTGTFSYAAVVAEVEVDPRTGLVKLLRLTAAHDCGFAINPMAVEGQMEGGLGMGAGQALWEQLTWDGGQPLNASFLDYKFPIALDTPEVESIIVESMDPNGPFGAKEAAEALNVAIVPAIANAVADAIGVRIHSLPITPEKVLAALERR
ncbi:MAG: molybdopterin-dependent oxidoreductase [Chloroflexi bacterium]|nr:molybdopterin-dependent oxidoreductase [Chloroflexota bacterium]